MGMPWFQIRRELNHGDILALSANFALYGDMSDRMASLVAALGHRHEVYSIDLSAPGYCCVSFEKEVVDWCCD